MNIFSNKFKITTAIFLMAFAALLFAVPAGLSFTNSSVVIVSQINAQTGCPTGQTYNDQTQQCDGPPSTQCPTGQTYNSQNGMCSAPVTANQQSAVDSLLNQPVYVVGNVIKALLLLFSSVVGLLIPVAASFVGMAMQINMDLLQPSANVAVSVGWDIFRVITNLGFVLGIIVIAVGTIVRSRSYRAQQILWRLIVAALLVNFSLVISGLILNVSDSLSKYFLASFGYGQYQSQQYDANTLAKNGASGISYNAQDNQLMAGVMADLVDYTGAANVQSPDKNSGLSAKFLSYLSGAPIFMGLSWNDISGGGSTKVTIGILLSLQLNLVLYVVILTTFIVLAGMIFIRYFYITVLLIISPIVWLMWIFPFGQRWWREWWNHFIKWAFMLPLNLFFLWLALQMKLGVQQVAMKMADNFSAGNASVGAVFTGTTSLSAVMGSLIAVAFIILGMKLSHKLGISAADGGVKMAQNAGGWVKDKAARGAGAGFARVGGGAAAENIGAKMSTWAGARKGAVTGWVARETVGRAGKGLIGVGATAEKRKAEPVFARAPEASVAEFLKMSKDRQIKEYAGLPREQQLGLLMAMQKQGRLDDKVAAQLMLGDPTKENLTPEEIRAGKAEIVRQGAYLRQGGREKESDAFFTSVGENERTWAAKHKDPSDPTYAEEIRNSRIEFNKKYASKMKDVGKAMFRQNEGDMTDAEKKDRMAHGDFINEDSSGKSYYSTLSGLGSDKMINLMRTMVKSMAKQTELTGKLKDAFETGVSTGNTSDLRVQIKQANPDVNDAAIDRIAKRIKSSVVGDMGRSAYDERKEGGGASSPAPEGEGKKGGK